MIENPIHVKLEYEKAIESKKYILLSEKELLEIIKIIQKYKKIRAGELEIKNLIYKRLKEIIIKIRRLEKLFPKVEEEKKEKKKKVKVKEEVTEDIELQLQEIRDRLRKLS